MLETREDKRQQWWATVRTCWGGGGISDVVGGFVIAQMMSPAKGFIDGWGIINPREVSKRTLERNFKHLRLELGVPNLCRGYPKDSPVPTMGENPMFTHHVGVNCRMVQGTGWLCTWHAALHVLGWAGFQFSVAGHMTCSNGCIYHLYTALQHLLHGWVEVGRKLP